MPLSVGIAVFFTGVIVATVQGFFSYRLWGWVAIATWSLSVAADIGIIVAMVFLLYRRRDELQVEDSTTLVDRLIKWTIETGMLTSIFNLVDLPCVCGTLKLSGPATNFCGILFSSWSCGRTVTLLIPFSISNEVVSHMDCAVYRYSTMSLALLFDDFSDLEQLDFYTTTKDALETRDV
ncbi:hypothetical protein K438DRAFT_1756970 [Mycena galopus ATCC 62051]|nr:hypothetical protein K438DRAFT_1756970 [Mycena galopus ATCC 62051]